MSREAQLIDELADARRAINSADAAQALRMLEYVDLARAEGEIEGGADAGRLCASAAIHELSLALRLPPATVSRTVARARRIRTTLVDVWAAWHRGEITAHQVQIIDIQIRRLQRPGSASSLDTRTARYAAGHTPGQLQRWLARQVERLEADESISRHRQAKADRHVRIQPLDDGMALLTAFLPLSTAAVIDTRLDSEARSLPSADPRTHEQARADAFTDLLLGPSGEQAAVQTVFGVTVPFSTLVGLGDTPGETVDRSGTIPAPCVREMASEGGLFWRLLTDDDGRLLSAGFMGRHAPQSLRTALGFRDGTTSFPTSDVPAWRCDADHTRA